MLDLSGRVNKPQPGTLSVLGRREAALELAAAGVAPLAHRCSWTELMDLEQRYYDCGFLQQYRTAIGPGKDLSGTPTKYSTIQRRGRGVGGCTLLPKVKSGQVA